jgi:hypothetical protein
MIKYLQYVATATIVAVATYCKYLTRSVATDLRSA